MWAFAIYDRKEDYLTLCVDRLSKKPLYYYLKEGVFIFSSEMKGIFTHNIKKRIDVNAIEIFMTGGIVPAPLTFLKDIRKMEAGTYLVYKKGKYQIKKYYFPKKYKPEYNMHKLIQEGKAYLEDATRIRLRADVEIAATLSGGYDSTAIVGFMKKCTEKKINTYNTSIKGKLDETKYARIAARFYNTIHHNRYCTYGNFESLMKDFSFYFDDLQDDGAIFSAFLLSENISKKTKVALGGDGGDEVFGGYRFHNIAYIVERLKMIPRFITTFTSWFVWGRAKELLKIVLADKSDFFSFQYDKNEFKSTGYIAWRKEQMKNLLRYSNGSIANAVALSGIFSTPMANRYVLKTDKTAMRYGLEMRSPFLDYRILEFSQKIPNKYKARITKNKILLKEIIRDLIPSELLKRRKQGFAPPVTGRKILHKEKKEIIEGIVILKKISNELKTYFSSKNIESIPYKYYLRIYLFKKWWDYWIND